MEKECIGITIILLIMRKYLIDLNSALLTIVRKNAAIGNSFPLLSVVFCDVDTQHKGS